MELLRGLIGASYEPDRGCYTYRGMEVEHDFCRQDIRCRKLVNGQVFAYNIPALELERLMMTKHRGQVDHEIAHMLERASREIDEQIRQTDLTAGMKAQDLRRIEELAMAYTGTNTSNASVGLWTTTSNTITMGRNFPSKPRKPRKPRTWDSKDTPVEILRDMNDDWLKDIKL
jgi:hypothetical protein